MWRRSGASPSPRGSGERVGVRGRATGTHPAARAPHPRPKSATADFVSAVGHLLPARGEKGNSQAHIRIPAPCGRAIAISRAGTDVAGIYFVLCRRHQSRRDVFCALTRSGRPVRCSAARSPLMGGTAPCELSRAGRCAGGREGEPRERVRPCERRTRDARIGVSARRGRRSPSTHQDRSGCILGGWGCATEA